MKPLALSLLLALALAGCGTAPPRDVSVPGRATPPARRSAESSEPAPPPGAPALRPPILPVDPKTFVERVDNPYFPLRPGTTFVFERRAAIESKPDTDSVAVTREIRTVIGVPAVVVRERSFHDRRLVTERTGSYAQDRLGNVWRLADEERTFDANGKATVTRAWEAGKDSAFAGVVMPGEPESGQDFRTGWRRGVAEGVARVASLTGTVRAMNESFSPCVVLQESSPLEPRDLRRERYYAPSLGLAEERMVSAKAQGGRILIKVIVAP